MNLRATHHGGRSSAIPSVLGTTTLLWSHFLNTPPPRVSSLNQSKSVSSSAVTCSFAPATTSAGPRSGAKTLRNREDFLPRKPPSRLKMDSQREVKTTGSQTIDLTGPETLDLTREDSTSNSTTTAAAAARKKKRQRRQRNSGWNDDVYVLPDDKKPAAVTAVFDCAVCLETGMERFRGYQLGKCRHLFCHECLHGYIQSKLKDKAVRALECPDAKCRQPIHRNDVRACTLEVGDPTLWHAYEELSTAAYLDSAVAAAAAAQTTNQSPTATAAATAPAPLRRCPTNHCNFTFEYEDRPTTAVQGQRLDCPLCRQSYCLNCPVVQGKVGPVHILYVCMEVVEEIKQSKEWQLKLEEWKKANAAADSRFQALLQREGALGQTMPCPHCKAPITKNGGCPHMHCVNCNRKFNWEKKRKK